MGSVDLIRVRDSAELVERAAGDWLELLRAVRAPAPFCVALLGGRIAPRLFGAFAERACRGAVRLEAVHFFWGDERCVPPEDLESNFGIAETHLLRPLRIPPEQIHRVQGEKEPEAAARSAERDLRELLRTPSPGIPVLDLVLLGMGEDGHVASLFPEEAELGERRVGARGLQGDLSDAAQRRGGARGLQEDLSDPAQGHVGKRRLQYLTARSYEQVAGDPRLYRPVTATKPPPLRITLGYGVIAAAREVWVLASGQGKAEALRNSIQERTTPLGCVLDLREKTRLYTDIPIQGWKA